MEFWKRQKKIMIGFGIFLAFMFLCTLISRAVYASKLPQVSVENPKKMELTHEVKTEGIVHQGREYAINVLSELRVRTVYVHVGDKVTEESLLFEIDTEDLEEKIREQEIEIKKLQLQIGTLEKNQKLEEQIRELGILRAQEDYAQAETGAQRQIKSAEDSLAQAREELKKKKDNPVTVTSEKERKAAQERYDTWVKEGEKLKAAKDKAEEIYKILEEKLNELEKADFHDSAESNAGESESKSEKQVGYELNAGAVTADISAELAQIRLEKQQAEEAYLAAQSAYLKHMENPVQKPDFSAEDNMRYSWEAEVKSLEDKVNAAAEAVEERKYDKQKMLQEAGRRVEDENREEAADGSLELYRLEMAALQEKLSALQKIAETEGRIYPEAEGIITGIHISPGERAGDGAAIVYADTSAPMQIQAALTREQKQYVNQGDKAVLTLAGSPKKEYRADYIAESTANPERFEVTVFLPEGTGKIGQSGTLEFHARSDIYRCCIPVGALMEDAAHRKFVYIVSAKDGILGKELAAEMVYVKVLDQNDSFAAIEEGVLDEETELIVSSTEPLEDRKVIRYRD